MCTLLLLSFDFNRLSADNSWYRNKYGYGELSEWCVSADGWKSVDKGGIVITKCYYFTTNARTVPYLSSKMLAWYLKKQEHTIEQH